MTTTAHNRVLCFSIDPRLLETRKWVLQKKYDAVCVGSIEEMESLAPGNKFDLVLLCHTISAVDGARAMTICRKNWPGAKVMLLASGNGEASPVAADQIVPGLDGPRALLHAIDDLLHPAIA